MSDNVLDIASVISKDSAVAPNSAWSSVMSLKKFWFCFPYLTINAAAASSVAELSEFITPSGQFKQSFVKSKPSFVYCESEKSKFLDV